MIRIKYYELQINALIRIIIGYQLNKQALAPEKNLSTGFRPGMEDLPGDIEPYQPFSLQN